MTSGGVLVGVALVAIFGWELLDPIVALLVGINIMHTGYGLLRRSVSGMLYAALPAHDMTQIEHIFNRYRHDAGVEFHALQTREAGRQRFIYVHLLVPDGWTVKRPSPPCGTNQDRDRRGLARPATTFVHIEPLHDPASYGHTDLVQPVPFHC